MPGRAQGGGPGGQAVKLEDLRPQAVVCGVLPERTVTVVNVQWFGTEAVELTCVDPGRRGGEHLRAGAAEG